MCCTQISAVWMKVLSFHNGDKSRKQSNNISITKYVRTSGKLYPDMTLLVLRGTLTFRHQRGWAKSFGMKPFLFLPRIKKKCILFLAPWWLFNVDHWPIDNIVYVKHKWGKGNTRTSRLSQWSSWGKGKLHMSRQPGAQVKSSWFSERIIEMGQHLSWMWIISILHVNWSQVKWWQQYSLFFCISF